jgi:hypothetical protein
MLTTRRPRCSLLMTVSIIVRLHGVGSTPRGQRVPRAAFAAGVAQAPWPRPLASRPPAALCAKKRAALDARPLFTTVSTTAPLASGQPPLTITYTTEGAAVSAWLGRHAADGGVLGFDTESVPTVRRTSRRFQGPATLQLASADGACLVVHLAHVKRKNCFVSTTSGGVQDAPESAGTGNRFQGLDDLDEVLQDTRVLKAGVGINLDAIDLWREHRLAVAARFDIGGIGVPRGGNRVQSLQKLAEMVSGFTLHKSKTLAMSDWSAVPLTQRQLEYAAADAFAAASVVDTLARSPPASDGEPLPSFCDLERLRQAILERERPIEEIDERAARRRAAKLEMRARQAALDALALSLSDDGVEDSQSPQVPVDKRLLRELREAPELFEAQLEEAQRIFWQTAPDRALSSDDFAALGML